MNGKGCLLIAHKVSYCCQEWQGQQKPWPISVRTPNLWTETLGPLLDSFLVTEGAPLLEEEFKLMYWHVTGVRQAPAQYILVE